MPRFPSTLLSTTLGLGIGLSAALQGQSYNLTNLGAFDPGRDAFAADLNDQAQVVGHSLVSGGSRGYLWEQGRLIDIGSLGGPGPLTRARAINEQGWIVGESRPVSGGQPHAFLRDPASGVLQDLGVLGGSRSVALGINDLNHVVGDSSNPVFTEGFRWIAPGPMTGIGTLGGCCSGAFDINNGGKVVGAASNLLNQHRAVLWDPHIGFRKLGVLSGGTGFSVANAINASEQVVGQSSTTGNPQDDPMHAFFWESGPGMFDLGTFGGRDSSAKDINDAGNIVGWAELPSGERRAFLWKEGLGLVDLNELVNPHTAWVLRGATAINESGQIICNAEFNGLTRPFLLDPLRISSPDPGVSGAPNRIELRGATSGARVTLAYSMRSGSTTLPGCSGRTLALQRANLLLSERADNQGRTNFNAFAPARLSGRMVFFQAVQKSSCAVSNLINPIFQ